MPYEVMVVIETEDWPRAQIRLAQLQRAVQPIDGVHLDNGSLRRTYHDQETPDA